MKLISIDSDNTSLFLVEDNQHKFCYYASIDKIIWGRKNVESCDYCGQVLVNNRCISCGAPVDNVTNFIRTGKATVILSGIFTKSTVTFDFRDGSVFEIYSIPYGRKDDFSIGNLFMRLSDCKMIERVVDSVVSFVFTNNDPIEYRIKFECLIDVFPVKETV